jgi:hypothetical protein
MDDGRPWKIKIHAGLSEADYEAQHGRERDDANVEP